METEIASKVLSTENEGDSKFNYDQTAYAKGRFIGESIRIIDDILYHSDQENLDGILFAADMEKTF